MNRYKYGSHVSAYHGSTMCHYVHVTRLFNARSVKSNVKEYNFVNAVKTFYKTKEMCSVVCKDDSNSLLIGNSRVIIPFPVEPTPSPDTFQLYLTPYYVNDPQLISAHLQGMALPAYDHVFPYKNCILYLDENDIPAPGGCYFDPIVPNTNPLYRLCLLTNEPEASVIKIASEWQARRGVQTLPFITRDMTLDPAIFSFQPIRELYFSDQNILSSDTIQKNQSLTNPRWLIPDILSAYVTHQLRQSTKSVSECYKNLGLIVEWPFRITYEGSKSFEAVEKKYVAIAVNGYRPTRVLHVRHPYERYIEYDQVPATLWTCISFEMTGLYPPPDVQKVSIHSTVVGFEYNKTFFCFTLPLLEGFANPSKWQNIQCMLSHGNLLANDTRIHVMERFQWNKKYHLNHVQMTGIPFDAWCLTKIDDHSTVYPTYKNDGSPLVEEWLQLMRLHKDVKTGKVVDTELIRLALLLTRHKICFKTQMIEKLGKNKNALMLNDQDITLFVGEDESKFLNDARVENSVQEEKEGSCVIM